MNIFLNIDDKDNPFLELVSAKGTRAVIDLRVLAEEYDGLEEYNGPTVGLSLRECLMEIREQASRPEGHCVAIISGVEILCKKHLTEGPILVHDFAVSVNTEGRAIILAVCPLCKTISRVEFFS